MRPLLSKYIVTVTISVLVLCLFGCGKSSSNEAPSATVEDSIKPLESVSFNQDQATSYLTNISCLFSTENNTLEYKCSLEKSPKSDDNFIYLFAFDTYESTSDFSKAPIASIEKGRDMTIAMEYNPKQLFQRFVPTLLVDKSYIPLSNAIYPGNPGDLANNQSEYPSFNSKKGLLIDISTLDTPLLDELNVTHAVYNMPLSFFMADDNYSGSIIEYEYDGVIYQFKEQSFLSYDALYTSLNNKGMIITAIILNDWNGTDQTLVHPKSREKTKASKYYQFNTTDEDGSRMLQATALYIANRYSTGEHGMVTSWVIGNEINQHSIWNYMNTTDIDEYIESYEKSFRIFYNAIKSNYANAKVYYSIDHDWNDNNGDNTKFFNGKELIEVFNDYALASGNYDWSIAIHPYPVPLTKVNYWSQNYDMTETAPSLTVMNLSTLTSLLGKENFLNPDEQMRSIAVTELGYTSKTGEKLQAAAFAYCYKIVEANENIDMFLLNRQTDSLEEMKTGLYLGLYNIDYTEKYIKEVFQNIDGENASEYEEILLNILNASSIEEALSWANP